MANDSIEVEKINGKFYDAFESLSIEKMEAYGATVIMLSACIQAGICLQGG